MSFTLKDIKGAVVENPEKDLPACTCDRCKGVRRGIEAQSSVKLRFNREKLWLIIYKQIPHHSTCGKYLDVDKICDCSAIDRCSIICDEIIDAEKELIEVEK